MDDIDRGFRIGGRRFDWGMTADEAARQLGVVQRRDGVRRWRRIEVGCGPTWGFDTVSAELTSQGDDRPVTALKYELAARPDDPKPDARHWVEPLSTMLGAPSDTRHDEPPAGADPSGSVRFYASWPAGDQSVGLSLYGAPRATAYGPAAGCLWLNWSTGPAAAPFVGDWRRRARDLEREADGHSGIVTFALIERQFPVHSILVDEDYTVADDGHYALGSPQLLSTPAVIARLLGDRGIGFWRSGDQRHWYASTRWDTIGFAMGSAVSVDAYDIRPAKGGGYSEIAVDGWRARDLHGSRAIDDAVDALRTIPGVTIRKVSGHDC